MKTCSALLLLVACATQAIGGTRELLRDDWVGQIGAYERRLVQNYQRSLAAGSATYDALLACIYTDRLQAEVASAKAYRATMKDQCALAVTFSEPVRVVADPSAESKGFHGYLFRSQGVILVAPPGTRRAYIPARRGVAFAHEVTHWAQRTEPLYSRNIRVWLDHIAERFPQNRGAYVLSPQEIEVRVADLRRMIRITGHHATIDAVLVRNWMGALGVPRAGRVQRFPQSVIDYLRKGFPDAFEILEVLEVEVSGAAEERRQALISFLAGLTPATL